MNRQQVFVHGDEAAFFPAQAGAYTAVVSNAAGVMTSFPAPLTVLADTDGDHLPDLWETANGLSPSDPADAALDPDGDGHSSLEEFRVGTIPTNALSVLRLVGEPAGPLRNQLLLRFDAMSNRTYTVEYADTLNAGAWTKTGRYSRPGDQSSRSGRRSRSGCQSLLPAGHTAAAAGRGVLRASVRLVPRAASALISWIEPPTPRIAARLIRFTAESRMKK
jgi:hypothetical protein